MISVVICSVNAALAAQVKENIAGTIGVPWELILLDNNQLKLGITSVYNLGAKQARYDVLCFVHEDVLFRTPDWGSKVLSYFEFDQGLGLIGVAGSKFKSKTPSGWGTGIRAFDCCNILHINKKGEEQRIFINPDPAVKVQEAVVIDGVFMCARKDVWERTPFDEQLLRGFHLYDLDFSFSVSRQSGVGVVFDIDIVHLTEGGDFGDKWVNYTLLWHKAKMDELPFSRSRIQVARAEQTVRKSWLHRLRHERISPGNRMRWIWRTKSFLFVPLWPYIVLFLFFRPYMKMRSKLK